MNQRPAVERLPLIENLEDRRVYRITSRNLVVGVWRAETKGFIGVRRKFNDEYLFEEYHWDTDPLVGTVRAAEPLDVVVPEDVPLAERLPGSWCRDHDRLVEWRPNEPGGRTGKWFHLDDDTQLAKDDWPTRKLNQALFGLLKPLNDAERRTR